MKNMKRKMTRILAVLLAGILAAISAGCSIDLTRVVKTEVPVKDLITDAVANVAVDSFADTLNSEVAVEEGEPVEEKKLTGKLTIQCFINENGVGQDSFDAILNSFQALNPDLEITAHVGPTVNSQLANTWTSGKGTPDVVFIGGKGLSESSLSLSGAFMDITDWFQEATVYGSTQKIVDKININALDLYNDRQFKAPITMSCYGLWYDETKYDEMGISIHKNFDEFVSNADVLKKNNMTSLIYPGMHSNYLLWSVVLPQCAAYGQEYFDSIMAVDKAAYEDERFVDILKKLERLSKLGYISASATQDHLGAQSDWLNHRSGNMASGTWLEEEMKNSIPGTFKMKYTGACLNAEGQKPGVILMPGGVAIASNTQNEENAKAFVRYLYTNQNMTARAVDNASLTVMKNQLSPDAYTGTTKDVLEYILSGEVTVVYKTTDMAEFSDDLCGTINKMCQGILTSEQAHQEILEATKRY